jgi:hypothetical protein
LIGLFITAFGIYITTDRIIFLGTSEITNAVVVGFHEDIFRGRSAYYPVFQFVNTLTGENVTAWGSLGSNPPLYSVGQEVEILYNPENPTVSVIANSFWDQWLFSIISLPLGIGLLIGASVFAIRKKPLTNS